jgi:hypothetical protein
MWLCDRNNAVEKEFSEFTQSDRRGIVIVTMH